MPIWRGKHIEFNPDVIAKLYFEGEEEFIHPDEGTSDQEYEHQQILVFQKLRKLWGSKKYREVTTSDFALRNILKRGKGNEDTAIELPAEIESIVGMKKIIPNPFLTNPEMPFPAEIESEILQRQRGRKSTRSWKV